MSDLIVKCLTCTNYHVFSDKKPLVGSICPHCGAHGRLIATSAIDITLKRTTMKAKPKAKVETPKEPTLREVLLANIDASAELLINEFYTTVINKLREVTLRGVTYYEGQGELNILRGAADKFRRDGLYVYFKDINNPYHIGIEVRVYGRQTHSIKVKPVCSYCGAIMNSENSQKIHCPFGHTVLDHSLFGDKAQPAVRSLPLFEARSHLLH